jgi:hypothetical protein
MPIKVFDGGPRCAMVRCDTMNARCVGMDRYLLRADDIFVMLNCKGSPNERSFVAFPRRPVEVHPSPSSD